MAAKAFRVRVEMKNMFEPDSVEDSYCPVVEGEVTEQFDDCTVTYNDGHAHKLDGPAVIYRSGLTEWCYKGQLHRTDGPAVEWPDGQLEWWIHGKRHRLDGPAIICPDGAKGWWINGKQLEPTEWLLRIYEMGLK